MWILTSDLVSESLRLDDRDVINDTLVGVEIASESKRSHLITIKCAYFP